MSCIAYKMTNDTDFVPIAKIKDNITSKANKYNSKYGKTKNAVNTEKTILATMLKLDNEVKECNCARCKYERFDPFTYTITRHLEIEYKKQLNNGFKFHTSGRNKYDFITNVTNAIAESGTKITYPIQKLNYLSRLFCHTEYNIFTKIYNRCGKISTQYVNMRNAAFIMFKTLDIPILQNGDDLDYTYLDTIDLHPFQMEIKNGKLTDRATYTVNETIDIDYESIDDGWLYYIKENEILRLKPIFVYILESHNGLPYQDITLLAFKSILPQVDLRHSYIAKYIVEVIYRDEREKNEILFDTLLTRTKNNIINGEKRVKDLIPTKREPRPNDLYCGYNLFTYPTTLKLTDFIHNFFCAKKRDCFFIQLNRETNHTRVVQLSKSQQKRLRKEHKIKLYEELEKDQRDAETKIKEKIITTERQVLFLESDSDSDTESDTETEKSDTETEKSSELPTIPIKQNLPITYQVDIPTESKNIIEKSVELLLKTNSKARETFEIYTEYVVIKDIDKHYTKYRYINMYLNNPIKNISSPLYHLYLDQDNHIRDITYVSSCF